MGCGGVDTVEGEDPVAAAVGCVGAGVLCLLLDCGRTVLLAVAERGVDADVLVDYSCGRGVNKGG